MLDFLIASKTVTSYLIISLSMLVLIIYSAIKKPQIPFVDPVFFFSKLGAIFSVIATISLVYENVIGNNPSYILFALSIINAFIFGIVLSKKSSVNN